MKRPSRGQLKKALCYATYLSIPPALVRYQLPVFACSANNHIISSSIKLHQTRFGSLEEKDVAFFVHRFLMLHSINKCLREDGDFIERVNSFKSTLANSTVYFQRITVFKITKLRIPGRLTICFDILLQQPRLRQYINIIR